MRIRKHANILIRALLKQEQQQSQPQPQESQLLIDPSTPLQVEKLPLIEVNRSPWDFITFKSLDSDLFYSHWLRKMKRESVVKVKPMIKGTHGAGGEPLDASVTVKPKVEIRQELVEEKEKPLVEDPEVLEMLKKGLKKKIGFKKPNEKGLVTESLPSGFSQTVKVKEGKLKGKSCNKSDGRGWRCKKPIDNGSTLCTHHLEQLRGYQIQNMKKLEKSKLNSNSKSKSKDRNSKIKGKPEGPEPKPVEMLLPAAKPSLSSRRNVRRKTLDNYFYTGFGPRRGKRKLDEDVTGGELLINLMNQGEKVFKQQANKEKCEAVPLLNVVAYTSPTAGTAPETIQSSKVVDHDADPGNLSEDDDDDDNYYNRDVSVGQKRARKPVKERSLKSLF